MKSAIIVSILAASSALAAPSKNGHPKPPTKPALNLNDLARKAGKLYFGTAFDNPQLSNKTYLSYVTNNHLFGQITPANGQKWMYIEPQRGVFNYSMGDVIIHSAIRHGQIRRCHNLVWHSQLPDWLTNGTWDKKTLISILRNHIKHEVLHYRGQCYAWDVVNEAFNEDGTLRETIFLTTIGPEYLEIAFREAAKWDPKAKLYYNDYNLESISNKTKAVAKMVSDFQKKGIKIDGVGMQAHLIVGQTPTYQQQVDNMHMFTKLGIEVAYTELDIRMYLPDNLANSTQQATDYANAVKACRNVKKCVGVTVWDFWDPVSWVPSVFSGQGDPTLFYANWTAKPAYTAVQKVLSS